MTERTGDAAPVILLGTGLLADEIQAEIPTSERAGPQAGSPPAAAGAGSSEPVLVVAASDAWDESTHPVARLLASYHGRPWLPVRTELGHAVIGPLEWPGKPGCVACAETRRRQAQPDRAERAEVRRRHHAELASRPASWLTGLAAASVAALVAAEVAAVSGKESGRTRLAVLRVDLATLAITRHPFLPDPGCVICGQPTPVEASRQAPEPLRLVSQPAYRPGSYRVRPVADELDSLLATYVDAECGLIRSLTMHSEGSLLVASAPVAMRNGSPQAGYGRSSRFRTSQLTAVLEGLERFGATPSGERPVVSGSWAQLQSDAIDPRTLGLYPPERYDLPDFPFQPFAETKTYRWVWGWSFAQQRPVLVPEPYAYYALPDGHYAGAGGSGFVYEISNGCALGGCLEEAILYGILEVAERDAFLLTWYAQLPAPRIQADTAAERTLPLMLAAISAETGYQVELFDITTEQGIPCVWAMAVNPRPGDGRPALACAAGSHPDPAQAVRNALAELGPLLSALIRRYAAAGAPEWARRMVEDPDLVREMSDHSQLYADPLAAQRLSFLREGTATRRVDEVGDLPPGGDDLRDDLAGLLGRYASAGLDVVVVDQTAPEHRAGGFACVKVLIPGTLSMTFGHQFRRVDGLPRLYEVPRLLGYRDRPVRPAEINPHPHPFP